MITKERYKEYDPRVREYMSLVLDSLTKEYSGIKEEWLMMLDMLAQNYQIYYRGYDDILTNGMYITDSQNKKIRNPAITLMMNSQTYIQKIITSMGWTILSKSRIKAPIASDDVDDTFND